MYTCSHCHRSVQAIASDPVVVIRRGTFHYDCFVESERQLREAEVNRIEEKRAKRARERARMELEEVNRALR